MSSRRKRVWSFVLGGTAVVSALGACTLALPGGLIGGLLALLLAGGLFFGVGASQSGCDSDKVQACLSATDACLSYDARIGPCLEPPLPDAGLDAWTGPCLQPPLPDAALDGRIGPCLEPPLPDAGKDGPVGPCLSPPLHDAGKDGPVGPCLSPPANPFDAGHAAATLPPQRAAVPRVERRALLAALDEQGRLPADVVARLKRGQGES